MGVMGEDELITSLSCAKWEVTNDTSVLDTWEGLLDKEGSGVKVFGCMSGVKVKLFGAMSFVGDASALSES